VSTVWQLLSNRLLQRCDLICVQELELAPGETTNGESTMSEDSLYSTTMADKHEGISNCIQHR
jgi:hypothetical protein